MIFKPGHEYEFVYDDIHLRVRAETKDGHLVGRVLNNDHMYAQMLLDLSKITEWDHWKEITRAGWFDDSD